MSLRSENNESSRTCEFQDNLELLRQIHFFSVMHMEALKVFAYLCTRETFPPEEYLFHQGDDDARAFYIISGRARLTREGAEGASVVREYDNGEFIGGLTLLGDMPRLFSLQAVSRMECLVLSREKFSKAMQQFPQLMPRILQAVINSVRGWEERFFADRATVCDTCMESCKQRFGVSLL